jgi:hypothetical protein
MKARLIATSIAALSLAASACSIPRPNTASDISSIPLAGARFEITDAAVYSNCLSLGFKVRAFQPPADSDPQAFFPPARTIDVTVTTPEGVVAARLLGGGGGGGGNEDDGRLWMEQRGLYSLPRSVPEGTEVTLEITAVLEQTFEHPDPLLFRITLLAGPGGGTCA